jgi:hypothetical protein
MADGRKIAAVRLTGGRARKGDAVVFAVNATPVLGYDYRLACEAGFYPELTNTVNLKPGARIWGSNFSF